MIKVTVVGLGPIGRKVLEFAAARKNISVVGAVDTDPALRGKKVSEICAAPGVSATVAGSFAESFKAAGCDVAVLTTCSSLKTAAPQIREILPFGAHVVSSCEELSFPWETEPGIAGEIDELAKKHNVAVLGTGVNPGFLMDFLPLALTGICQEVSKIEVERIQDASVRRLPFQRKIGAGLTLDQFEEKKRDGSLRHVGLTESIHMIASRMNWKIDRAEDVITPIVAERETKCGEMTIRPGMAAGVQQVGRGIVGGEEKIRLLFRAAIGEPGPREVVRITGSPSFESKIDGGINGDTASCAIVVNAVASVTRCAPGLRTMADTPPVTFQE